MKDKNRCQHCTFHEPHPEPGRNGRGEVTVTGNCMRYPPQITPGGSSFPVVGSDVNWCGELVVSAATIEQRATPKRKAR